MPASAEELVELLDLETIDLNLFRGKQPDTRLQRVFGGQVAAQALVAGGPHRRRRPAVHSLHSYFLRPGDPAVPIVYDVERVRDGRSFATRRVLARQHGRPIYALTASFQVAEEASSTRTRCPTCPGPTRPSTSFDCLGSGGDDDAREEWLREWAALDLRCVGDPRARPAGTGNPTRPGAILDPGVGRAARRPLVHRAALTYLSDLTLLGAALVPQGLHPGQPGGAGGLAGPLGLVPPRRSVPTSGCSTTRCSPSRLRRTRAGPRPAVHPGRARWWPRWRRRA